MISYEKPVGCHVSLCGFAPLREKIFIPNPGDCELITCFGQKFQGSLARVLSEPILEE